MTMQKAGSGLTLRIGTRASNLARTQSEIIAARLRAAATTRGLRLTTELVPIVSHGDLSRTPLVGLSEPGVFVKSLRTAILADECDLLVHSLKDMPTQPFPGLKIGAVTERGEVRDALCGSAPLAELPAGAVIGTSSPRRAAQILAFRPDVRVTSVRGNVERRLSQLEQGFDAVVLAAAGLERLGYQSRIAETYSTETLVPAPGQGALAVELRADASPEVADLVGSIDSELDRATTTAERTALQVLEAGCAAPMGAYGRVENGRLTLHVRVLRNDGTLVLNETASGPVSAAEELGRQAAHALLGRGADQLLR